MPLRRLPVAILRTEVSVLFFARAVMAAFSIDILVYEVSLASGNCVDPRRKCTNVLVHLKQARSETGLPSFGGLSGLNEPDRVAWARLTSTLHGVVFAIFVQALRWTIMICEARAFALPLLPGADQQVDQRPGLRRVCGLSGDARRVHGRELAARRQRTRQGDTPGADDFGRLRAP